jgi:hypothetical protein
MHDAVSADPHLALPSIEESDEQIGGLLLRGEGNPSRLDRGNDVEQILDGIAGAPGVGRGFLERWGSMLATQAQEGGAIVTVREAQKFHATEVLRRVDVWLEGKDEDSVIGSLQLICIRSYSIIGCCSAEVSPFLCTTPRITSSSEGCPGIC